MTKEPLFFITKSNKIYAIDPQYNMKPDTLSDFIFSSIKENDILQSKDKKIMSSIELLDFIQGKPDEKFSAFKLNGQPLFNQMILDRDTLAENLIAKKSYDLNVIPSIILPDFLMVAAKQYHNKSVFSSMVQSVRERLFCHKKTSNSVF